MSEASALENIQTIEIDFIELDRIIEEEFNKDKENLIMMLQAIQRCYNYLPRPALEYLSTKIGVPISRIYGVATFYSTFSLEPRGRNIVTICLGTACHVRGGERIKERLESHLGIHAGDTTEDMPSSVKLRFQPRIFPPSSFLIWFRILFSNLFGIRLIRYRTVGIANTAGCTELGVDITGFLIDLHLKLAWLSVHAD